MGFHEHDSEKTLEKESDKTQGEHVSLGLKKLWDRFPACAARASRHSFVPDKERQETRGKKQKKGQNAIEKRETPSKKRDA